MFYRIFGNSGSGKTSYIFDRLSECVKDKRKAFLVVPEQSAVESEKEVIKRLGGKSNLYVEVINFKRLCNRVFRELGGLTSAHLDSGAQKMLMLMNLEKISPFLTEYSKSVGNAEFAEKALSIVNEMKTFKVSAKMLEDAAEKIEKENKDDAVSKKLRDIALISEGYNAVLSSIPGTVCDIYEKLCTKLREELFFSGTDVFFDSFYGFTESEYEIISLISEQADNTYVTFACKKDCDDEIFGRSTKAAKKCEKIALQAGCEVCDVEFSENRRHKNASGIYAFKEHFSTEALSESFMCSEKTDDSLTAVLCRNTYEEVKWALSKVMELVRGGDRFSDIVICARNTSDYVGVIDTLFAKAGVPLGMDMPETLSESALFELVTSALEAASTFNSQPIIRYVKTGLSGLSEQEADIYETYIRTWNISPRLFRDDEDWTMNPDGYVDSQPDEDALSIINSARRKVFVCLDSLSENLKGCKTVKDFCLAVYNLIQDIKRVSESNSFYDANEGISLALLYECLDSFSASAANEKITLSGFVSLIKSCGKDYNTGHIPSLSDEVRFSDVTLVRCDNVKHVIILGVNNGVFPSSCKPASLISDSEKKQLRDMGITLSENSEELVFDEMFLAYCAITGASESCHISYLAEDSSSAALFPSVIVSASERITGRERIVFDAGDFDKGHFSDELLFEEMMAMYKGEKKNTLMKYFSSKEEYSKRLESYKNILSDSDYLLPSTADELYGNTIVTSYSRLEKMAGCPFSHFCTYTLRLRPEPKATLGPSEAGSVMHKILEELVPLLCKEKEDGTYPDEDEAKALVSELLCEHLSSIAHTDVQKVPKRFVYLYNRLSRMLCEMAVNIVRELKVTKFRPVDFELNISRDSDVKPFPIDLGNGCTLYIIGQVDRVDVYENDGVSYVRIIDYKTGSKLFKLDDIRCGFNLQMLLYLASISKGGKAKYGENIVPAGVLYSNVVSAEVSKSLGIDDICDGGNDVTKPTSSGIFLDDENVLFAMDPNENSIYLPIGRKNGEIKKKDAVISLEGMTELLGEVVETARELAGQMRAGLKSVTPFDSRGKDVKIDPCRYCDMKKVCMKEQGIAFDEE